MNDKLHGKRKQERIERKSQEKAIRAETWLIVCEGEKTEPKYFERLIEYVNLKSEKKIKFKIEGTGRNTESLVSSIDKYFSFIDDLKRNVNIPYGKIFAVFDKDSFGKGQFNNAIDMAERNGYIALWSNECFELWYLLHFEFLSSQISREIYFDKLDDIFGKKYDKKEDNFDLLDTDKKLKTAVKYAKKLYKETDEISSFAERKPCTTVFKLIEEIEQYTGIKLC